MDIVDWTAFVGICASMTALVGYHVWSGRRASRKAGGRR